MRFVRFMAFLVAFSIAFVCRAETWMGRADVSFKGTSTLHEFRGHGETEPFAAELSASGPSSAPRMTCRAELKVGQLSTDNKSRDKSMYDMFRAVDFPAIVGAMDDVEVGAAVVPLTIIILGMEQTVRAGAADWKSKAGARSFVLEFDVSLSASGLKAPRAAAGLIRVGDAVHVTVRVELARQGAGTP